MGYAFVDVYENFLKRSQSVAGGRRRSQAVGTPKANKRDNHTLPLKDKPCQGSTRPKPPRLLFHKQWPI